MDTNGKAPTIAEISMPEKTSANGGDVVVLIPSEEGSKGANTSRDAKGSPLKDSESTTPKQCTFVDLLDKGAAPMSHRSPEIARFSPSPSPGRNKPPKIPTNETLMRRRSLARSVYSKPKSRFGEQSYPVDHNVFEERERDGQGANSPFRNPTSNRASPNSRAPSRNASITPKTPLMASPGGVGVDEYEEICKKVNSQLSKEKSKKVKTKVLVEWVAFVCILGCLVASLTVEELLNSMFWGLEMWKWCVLVMVIFCGMLVTNWVMNILVFIIERNFLLRKKVLYFVHGLKKSVQVFIWFALILLTWVLLFNRGVERSANTTKILDVITWTIVSFLIGAFLWLFKTLLLKILASSFHVNTFFDRIQESVFHQYVLQTLSGPPLVMMAERVGRTPSAGRLSFKILKKGKEKKEKKEVIDMAKLHKMKQGKVSSWTMKVMVDAIASSGLSTLSNTLDETVYDGGGEQTDREITSEMEAMAAAYEIFTNVANGSKYIVEDDLLNFMIKEEVDLVFPLFGVAAETGQIDLKCLTDWVVKVYKGRKALAHALNDTKTAVKQLNKLVTAILIVVMIIVWLLLVGIANTKVLVVLSGQLVVAAFMFGNTCKTIFEAIIFVFVMHPFDVGDRCIIDGIQMVVEEQNILNTVFLKFDNEKIYYPNSVLSTKPIGNFYRSPDMVDNIEFCLDFMTPVEKIGNLKDKIRKHLESNSLHWHPGHNLVVKEFENVNKIKMALFFSHTMNFQDFAEKTKRRSQLVIELKKIFEELNIKYNLLPQEVHLRNVGSATMPTATTTR